MLIRRGNNKEISPRMQLPFFFILLPKEYTMWWCDAIATKPCPGRMPDTILHIGNSADFFTIFDPSRQAFKPSCIHEIILHARKNL